MNLSKHFIPALRTTLVLAIFTGLLFPALVHVIAHLFFVNQAEGSLLRNKEGTIIGSHLIGQTFSSPQYFHPRPSAAGSGYDAAASGGTNLGPTSKKLIEGDKSFAGIEQLAKMYRVENNLPSDAKIPIDSVTRSASGLDPHISIDNAKLQALRVARARHIALRTVLNLIEINKTPRQLGFLGEPCVNVLELNLALDKKAKRMNSDEIKNKGKRQKGTPLKRPDAEKLLAKIKAQEIKSSQGKLKIFLGFAAGVGKTYTMLEAGHKLLKNGVDLVVGCVVTHGRAETEALLKGLPLIPLKTVEYKGATLEEFDLDTVLARRPTYVLLDELAHTNIAGSRHQKRYQDVEELLDAGINVYATLNVQHLESNSDIVSQITNISIKETVPDSILERANEIELVDITPEELIQRFHEGKVYMPAESERALDNFFKKGNLIALRELSLRVAAEKIDIDMQHYREDEDIQAVWPVSEKFVVCVSASPLSPRLVRATKRLASSMHAEWLAVYVQTADHIKLSEKSKARLFQTLNLAERLGAQVVTLTGENVAEEVLSFARTRNVTKIVIGKATGGKLQYLRDRIFGSLVDKITHLSGNIDVYVITGDPLPGEITDRYLAPTRQTKWKQYIYALAIVALATLIDHLVFHKLKQVNLVMIYLLAIVFAATRYGPGPSALASILSVACFDFFFVPPYMSFAVTDTQYFLTLLVMLTVALTLSTLTVRGRQQTELAKQRERQTAALYAMTREQVTASNIELILAASLKHLNEVFDSKAVVLLPDEHGALKADFQDANSYTIDAHEMGVAQWVYSNKQVAGAGTTTLPGAKAIYLPLLTTRSIVGVIGLLPLQRERLQNPEEMHFLETFIYQIALAVEREAS